MNKHIDELNKKLKFAFSCIQNNNHLEAIKIYEEILQENQNNFDANSNLGMLYAQHNNLDKSEEYLNKAIEIDPKNPYAFNNLASILIKLGKNEEAVKFSQIAINLKENFSGEPKLTNWCQRVLQRAAIHVQSSGRENVTGANMIVALFSEKESHAVYFLHQQNMTRLDAVQYISCQSFNFSLNFKIILSL